MPQSQRLTTSSDETELGELLSGDHVFSIPYFQRPYRWKEEKLSQLRRDLLAVVDGAIEIHFLGAIILHGRRANPSQPTVFDVIDGQQRITTLYLFLCAAAKVLCDHGEYQDAAGLYHKYLVIARSTALTSNLKLHSCKEDRLQLNEVFGDLLANGSFRRQLAPFKTKLLPAVVGTGRTLRDGYASALRFLREQVEQEGLSRLRDIYSALLGSMSVVQINVTDPTDGPRIFDSLNSKQEPMTIGDLVRNDIFSRVADLHPNEIEDIDQRHWQPFYKKFQQGERNLFESYFFPYGLIRRPGLLKSQVYAALREEWRTKTDPVAVIEELATYQDAFIDIACGTNLKQHSAPIAEGFRRLTESGAPSSTYPFLMQLSNEARGGGIPKKHIIASLEMIESFLVRRAICGHEPTGLHAVFKRLWLDCNGEFDREAVKAAIRKHKTVVWPSDSEVVRAIERRALYGSKILPYLLSQFDRSLGGDEPSVVTWVEHVLPETPHKDWWREFGRGEHRVMKDLIANLIPLSRAMNARLRNSPYGAKRKVYLRDSALKSAREFAREFSKWTPQLLRLRSKKLAEWTIGRWQY